jgi:two-component system, cell cycle sensor histidine kinase and response regulator CckA
MNMVQDRAMTYDPEELRRRAESILKGGQGRWVEPEEVDPLQLLHELQVHQTELEMQNDELRRAELELEKSRDRYQALYDQAPIGYLTLDPRGTILDANLTATTLLELERPRLLGRTLSSFMATADADQFHLYRQELFASDTKLACELRLESEGGREFCARLESIAVPDAPGEQRRCRTVLLDLSELRAAQQGLRTHESRTRMLLDTASDAIIGIDTAGRIESFNQAAERMFGYRETEVQGRNVDVLMSPSHRDAHQLYIERYLATGEARIVGKGHRELIGLRKDGTTFALEIGVGEWWDGGQRKFTAVIRDISARKQTERKLNDSEARFRQIAEHIEDVFYVHERDGTISYVSPAYERVWGRTSAELVDSSAWLDAVHPDDREGVARDGERVLAGQAVDTQYRVCRPDGSICWVRDRAFPVEDEHGNVVRAIGIVQDVTAARQLEEELLQAQKMEAIGTLASGIAHDFRNLLQVIMGCAYLALEEMTLPAPAGSYVNKVVETAKRGASLINQLMSFSHKRSANPRPLRVDAAINELAALLSRLVGEHIPLEVDAGAPHSVIMADPVQLEQILMNLAANARDATPEGGIITIRTEEVVLDQHEAQRRNLTSSGRHVRIIVQDTGEGMDESTRRRIFEPFFTTKAVGKGTGLGLSTVFTTVRGLGGHIEAGSERGLGTTFTLHLPCCDDELVKDEQAPDVPSVLQGAVLLVEDEELVRVTVRHYLEALGLEVVEAPSAEAALCICEARQRPIDMLISDVMMPGMTGARLAGRLRQRYAGLGVLYMSAYARDELIESGVIESDAAIVQKPFDKQILAARLREMLQPG